MNDPHVEALHYRFVSETPSDDFSKAAPLEVALGSFDIRLEDGELIARPHDHYADEQKARDAFESALRSWEEHAFLTAARYRIRFKFSRAAVIDRAPTPGRVFLRPRAAAAAAGAVNLMVIRACPTYPSPPDAFVASDLTTKLLQRLRDYRDGRGWLCAMGYALLNELEHQFGDRRRVAATLAVEEEVLNVLGDLTAVNDPRHGRKSWSSSPRSQALGARDLQDPLTEREIHWMEEACRQLIVRLGEYNAIRTGVTQLTMGHLPPHFPHISMTISREFSGLREVG